MALLIGVWDVSMASHAEFGFVVEFRDAGNGPRYGAESSVLEQAWNCLNADEAVHEQTRRGERAIVIPFPFCYTSSGRRTVGGERHGRNHKFPTRTHGDTRGNTQHCWTCPDQLETRAWMHQIPTISSCCRLLYSTAPCVGGGKVAPGARQRDPEGAGLTPFSCSSLTPTPLRWRARRPTQREAPAKAPTENKSSTKGRR